MPCIFFVVAFRLSLTFDFTRQSDRETSTHNGQISDATANDDVACGSGLRLDHNTYTYPGLPLIGRLFDVVEL